MCLIIPKWRYIELHLNRVMYAQSIFSIFKSQMKSKSAVFHLSHLRNMALIPGTIGKRQAIFDFLVELQIESVSYETDGSNCKRQRVDSNSYVPIGNNQPRVNANGGVQFPITIPAIDTHAWNELLTELGKFEKQNLEVKWQYSIIEDSIFAAIQVISSGEKHLIAENECVIISNQFHEDNTETIGNDSELFVAIVYAAHTSLIKTSNLKLCPSADHRTLLLHMDLVYNMELAQINRATKLMLALSSKVQINQGQLQQAGPVNILQGPKVRIVKCKSSSNADNINQKLSIASDESIEVNKCKSSSNTNNVNQEVSTASGSSIEVNKCNQQLTLSSNMSNVSLLLKPPAQPLPLDSSIESFYTHVHPPVSSEHLESFTPDKITVKLAPFQTQNVRWMIHREGHLSDKHGTIKPNHDIFNELPLLYTGSHIDNDRGYYMNSLRKIEMIDRSNINTLISISYRGGILADEMGLGKTVRYCLKMQLILGTN